MRTVYAFLMQCLYQPLRFVAVTFGLIQRIPMTLFLVFGIAFFWLLYRLSNLHAPLVGFVRFWIRCFCFLNGIRIRYDKASLSKLKGNVIIADYPGMNFYFILFLILPFRTVFSVPDSFLEGMPFKSLFYLLGFFRSQKMFDVHSYQKKEFQLDAYAKAGFNLVECVDMASQNVEPVATAFVVGLKHYLSVVFLSSEGIKGIPNSSFFLPKTVRITIVDHFQITKRPELASLEYRSAVSKYLKDARPLEHQK